MKKLMFGSSLAFNAVLILAISHATAYLLGAVHEQDKMKKSADNLSERREQRKTSQQ